MTEANRSLEDLEREVADLSAQLDARLSEVEQLTGTSGLGLRTRIAALEKRLASPPESAKPKPGGVAAGLKTTIDYGTKIVSALTPVAVLLVGLFLTGAVERALEERKVEIQQGHLDLEATQAMEHLLEQLRQPNIGEEQAKSIALLVAGYGVHATVPLIMELDLEKTKYPRIEAAKYGLRSMALSAPDRRALCATLVELLRFSTTSAFFQREGLMHAVDLTGLLRCAGAAPVLPELPRGNPDLDRAIDAASAALAP
jgi:hypothetical protein